MIGLIALAMSVDGLTCRRAGCTRPYQTHLVTMATDNLRGRLPLVNPSTQ